MTLNSEKPTIVSLFCGAGGLDYGFNKAGFKSILGIDKDKDSCMTYKNAFNTEVLNKDILMLDIHDIPDSDVILSSIITPGFSLVSNNDADFSNRNKLLYRVLEIIKLKVPKALVFECVKSVRSYDKGSTFDYFINFLEELGYKVSYQVLNTLHYSIPQTRERLVIVGIYNGFSTIRYEFPKPHKEKVTLKEIFNIENINENPLLPIDTVNLRKYDRVFELDTVASTLIGVGQNCYIKYGEFLKKITSKEAAVIQSFPRDYNFIGNENSQYRQIVSAYPPGLSYYIAQELKRYFEGESVKFEPYIVSLTPKTIGNDFHNYKSKQLSMQNRVNKKDKSETQLKILGQVQAGSAQAYEYEDVIFKNLEYIFDNQLKRGKKQVEIHEGRKRVDIVFDNGGKEGFFAELITHYQVKSAKIMIECKNYNGELNNRDFDQLLGRFNKNYGEFGILICREIYNKEKIIKTCKDYLHSGKGWIIVLCDEDMKMLLNYRESEDYESINDYMSNLISEVIL
ncbi:DNA cytosine methyltransferase [Lysinibacillus xylanilyticus]|uniref:DNA cytosine methyltransferase n=1 Tax=Lysinibacillus xylanilyticus TaxID=582475 RepID=UPI0036D8617A